MPEKFYIELGDRLRTARTKKGYSLQDVAERVGKSRKTILNWETGTHKIDMDVLKRVCDILDLDVRKVVDELIRFL